MLIVVMGVSGCGKTTVGELLAKRLSLPFFDADNFHTEENVRKMRDGVPLTDQDRAPWLATLSVLLQKHDNKEGCVLACSALKEEYRKTLRAGLHSKQLWVHLEGTQKLLEERMKKREGHYMAVDLLTSQFEALERPAYALHIPVTLSPENIVDLVMEKIKAL